MSVRDRKDRAVAEELARPSSWLASIGASGEAGPAAAQPAGAVDKQSIQARVWLSVQVTSAQLPTDLICIDASSRSHYLGGYGQQSVENVDGWLRGKVQATLRHFVSFVQPVGLQGTLATLPGAPTGVRDRCIRHVLSALSASSRRMSTVCPIATSR